MRRVCAWCKKVLAEGSRPEAPITHGICPGCSAELFRTLHPPTQDFLDSLEIPILVVDGGGIIISTNVTLQEYFGRAVTPGYGRPGDEVFNCDYAQGPKGCGGVDQCEDCGIRHIVAETHRTGVGSIDAVTHLDLKEQSGVRRIWLRVTTEKVADKVLIKVMETSAPDSDGRRRPRDIFPNRAHTA